MAGSTFTTASDPWATYTIRASNIYGTKEFIVENTTVSMLSLSTNGPAVAETNHVVIPHDAVPVAMLIDWLYTHQCSLQRVYEAREELNPQYDLEDGEDIDHLEAIDEIESFYWLFKLAYDTHQKDLRSEVISRFLGAIRTGNPWLVGDLWDRLDDAYPSKNPEREALHWLTATIVKKMTLSYRHQTEFKPIKRTYEHVQELAQDQVYNLEWKIAQMCWDLEESTRH